MHKDKLYLGHSTNGRPTADVYFSDFAIERSACVSQQIPHQTVPGLIRFDII